MPQECNILIADRNRHVRQFLQRELLGEGYHVILAGEGRELAQLLKGAQPPDLLILDPDIPSNLAKPELITLLHGRHPALPIIIFTLGNCDIDYSDMPGVESCLEKGENIDLLKKVVADVLRRRVSAES